MSNESNNITSWRNWGDHPLFVLLSAIGIIIGIIFGILSYYKSDKPSNDEVTTSITPTSPANSSNDTPHKDFTFGLYINAKVDRYGNFSRKFETVIMEMKPKKISIINLKYNKSIWSITPEDFSFDWDEGYLFSSKNSPKLVFREMFDAIVKGSDSDNCINIFDLKRRIAKDKYQKNIVFTNSVSSCSNKEEFSLDFPSDKKMLVLLVAEDTTNPIWFYDAEETLKKVFPTGEVLPFVSITEKQLIDFLQTQ